MTCMVCNVRPLDGSVAFMTGFAAAQIADYLAVDVGLCEEHRGQMVAIRAGLEATMVRERGRGGVGAGK